MRILCVTRFPVAAGDRWLWNDLPAAADDVHFIQATRACGHWLRQVDRRARQEPFDLIVTWENGAGLPLALWRWLRAETRPPLVFLTLAAKPYLRRLRFLARRWLRGVTHITAPSNWEATRYGSLFHLPASHISACPLGSYDVRRHMAARGRHSPDDGHRLAVFAGGRTDRDYATLLTALADVPASTMISAPSTQLRRLRQPAHVTFAPLLPVDDYFAALMRCRIVAAPLRPVPHAAGLTLLLDAMSAGRPVVCADLPVTREYVTPGVTGLLLPPGEATAWRDGLLTLLGDAERCRWMGEQARARWEREFAFPRFARRAYAVLRRAAAVEPEGHAEAMDI
ncbi:MAG: glycosyltransferase family 4 protein [Ardenticatenales bacterium]|nr:glycosyltransferase family 4 protein [Ardenticatenales bacterium]